MALSIYVGIRAIIGPKIERNDTCSFRKQNVFNNVKKDGKFGTDLVDSMLNTAQASTLGNVSLFNTY